MAKQFAASDYYITPFDIDIYREENDAAARQNNDQDELFGESRLRDESGFDVGYTRKRNACLTSFSVIVYVITNAFMCLLYYLDVASGFYLGYVYAVEGKWWYAVPTLLFPVASCLFAMVFSIVYRVVILRELKRPFRYVIGVVVAFLHLDVLFWHVRALAAYVNVCKSTTREQRSRNTKIYNSLTFTLAIVKAFEFMFTSIPQTFFQILAFTKLNGIHHQTNETQPTKASTLSQLLANTHVTTPTLDSHLSVAQLAAIALGLLNIVLAATLFVEEMAKLHNGARVANLAFRTVRIASNTLFLVSRLFPIILLLHACPWHVLTYFTLRTVAHTAYNFRFETNLGSRVPLRLASALMTTVVKTLAFSETCQLNKAYMFYHGFVLVENVVMYMAFLSVSAAAVLRVKASDGLMWQGYLLLLVVYLGAVVLEAAFVYVYKRVEWCRVEGELRGDERKISDKMIEFRLVAMPDDV